MAATLINSTVILNEILALLRTNCISLQSVNRQYDNRFGDSVDLKPGTTLYARKPVQYEVTSGKKLTVQDTVEESVAISATTQIHIGFPAFTSEQLTMNVDDFSERYIKPAASRLAAELDKLILQHAALNFWQYVGTAGTTPATATVVLQAKQKLSEQNAPTDNRFLIIDEPANTSLINAFSGLYNPQKTIAGQWQSGVLTETQLGLKMGPSSNIHRLTCGSRVGTIVTDEPALTNVEEGMTTIHMDGFTNATDTIKQGEKFTIADVYAVTPETKITMPHLQQFTVTADATCASNEVDVTFSPAIRSTGARQNVNALPADGKGVTFLGTASTIYPFNICMHKDALTLVTADLKKPKGVHDAARQVLDGVSLRFITDYDGKNDEFFSRLDLFYGISTLRGELGCVLIG